MFNTHLQNSFGSQDNILVSFNSTVAFRKMNGLVAFCLFFVSAALAQDYASRPVVPPVVGGVAGVGGVGGVGVVPGVGGVGVIPGVGGVGVVPGVGGVGVVPGVGGVGVVPGVGGVGVVPGVGSVGGIIGADSTWGTVRRPGDIINPPIGPIGGDDCLLNEVPSFWNGRIERCSFRDFQCNDPTAQCRMNSGRFGTCCRPRGIIANTCRNNLPGLGSCFNDFECRQFGRNYECQFRRGRHGTCCPRNNFGIRY